MASKMAESNVGEGLKKLEEQLTCPICTNRFMKPKTLPCFHSFCLSCLEDMLESAEKSGDSVHNLSCPTCRSKFTVPKEGLAALPLSFVVNNLVEVHTLIKKVSTEQHAVPCDNCADDKASNNADHYCKQCAKFFCSECLYHHDNWKPNADHETITVAEVASTAHGIVQDQHTKPLCPDHSGKSLELFCVTCQKSICHLCTVKKHKDHNHEVFDDETYESHFVALNDSTIKPLNCEIDQLTQAKAILGNRTDGVTQQVDAIFSEIDNMIAEFQECLNREKDRLKGNLKVIRRIKLATLKQQTSDVDEALTRLIECRDHIELLMKVGSRHDVLSAKEDVIRHSADLITEVAKSAPLYMPKEQADIELVRKNMDVKAIFENMAELHLTSASVPICDIVCHAPVVGIESTASMYFFLPDGSPAPIPGSAVIKCRLVPCYKQCQPIECRIKETTPNTAGQYQIIFTPLARGRHQIHVTVQDKEVPGSPVDVAATVPPEMMTKPVMAILPGVIKEPRGVAVINNAGRQVAVVSDGENHCITIVSQKAGTTRYRNISSKGTIKGCLRNPRGVAITSANTILVADKSNHRIQEFTMKGEYVASIGSKGNGPLQFNCPHGLFIDKTTEKVFITDHDNNRVVVLNPDMTYSHTFGNSERTLHPQDITVDMKGFAYVLVERCIHKFTTEGQFVSSFSHSEDGIPGCGITAGENNQLFINGRNGRVTIITTNGELKGMIGDTKSDQHRNIRLSACKYQSMCYDSGSGYLFICSCLVNVVKVY